MRRPSSAVCPVTALAFFTSRRGREYVLAGEDVCVCVYDAATGARVRAMPVLKSQPVHGIFCAEAAAASESASASASGSGSASALGPPSLVVWGNNAVVGLDRDVVDGWIESPGDSAAIPPVPDELAAPDWVHDVQMSPHDPRVGILATAHNEAVLLRHILPSSSASSPGRLQIMARTAASPSRPMLYSASVCWTAPDATLVAAGTVFGEIHVWTCAVVGRDGGGDDTHHLVPRMRCVLTGHEGSIYGVRLHATAAGEMLLASCSDDRTVRVWDAGEEENDEEKEVAVDAAHAVSAADARETGFSEHAAGGAHQLAVALGHVSRVWGVRFLDDATVCSYGEDCAAIAWRLAPAEATTPHDDAGVHPGKGPRSLVKCDARVSHEGRHVWASAARALANGRVLTATGGADGRVVLAETAASTSVVIDATGEKFRQVEFVSDDTLVATTGSGRIVWGRVGAGHSPVKWLCCAPDDPDAAGKVAAMGRTTVVRRVADGVAAVGTTRGGIFLASAERVCLAASLDSGSVADVFPLEAAPWGARPSTPRIDVLVVRAAAGLPPVVATLPLDAPDHPASLQAVLGYSDRGIVTSAAYVGEAHLVIGSRQGFLDLVARVPAAESSPSSDSPRVVSQSRVGSESLTAVVALSPTRFATASRDGKFRIHELVLLENTPATTTITIRTIHQETPPLGPFLDSAWLAPGSAHILLSGFRNGAIVVHDHTARQDVAVVAADAASGPHHSFTLTRGGGPPRVAYARAARLLVHTQLAPPQRIIRAGTGGREIRAVDAITLHGTTYLAAGSEDNVVRVYAVDGGLRCVAVLKRHSSGLQQVRWLPGDAGGGSGGDARLLTSSGHEELFVWRATPLGGGPQGTLGISFEAELKDVSRDRDLRITDFAATWGLGGHPPSPGVVRVSVARSDSSFRSYAYHVDPPRFEAVTAPGRYTGACLTQVAHLAQGRLLTAATDGCVAVWEASEGAYVLARHAQVHRGSVKALVLLEERMREVVVATGGDDNALALSVISMARGPEKSERSERFERPERAERPESVQESPLPPRVVADAHAASITGLAALPGGELVSCSNDQRVRRWRWQLQGQEEENGREVVLVDDARSGVADPGGMCVLDGGGVVVAGVGVEVWGSVGG